MFVAAFLVFASCFRTTYAQSCDSVEEGYQCNSEISHNWGQYAPFFSVASDIDNSIPSGCDVTFVQVLSRHGARDPTASKTAKYNATVLKIQSSVTSYGSGFEFIKDYEYTLGADQLTTFGQQELVNSGIKFFNRYQALASATVPFFRSSGEERVVESAQNWTQGFQQARSGAENVTSSELYPFDILVVSEADGSNNTLNHGLCTAFEEGPASEVGDAAIATWISVFVPNITARLNANLPGANLTDTETIYVMDLCPFNTVANDNGTVSPFCDLFTADEWESYGYYLSLDKFYSYGFGNPLGPTQGVGFTNELVARLTNASSNDHTSSNATLDGNQATFPLGLPLYADFTHDSDMVAIYSAMGLYNSSIMLSNTTRQTLAETGGFSTSVAVPFSARMYVEKMTCSGESGNISVGEELVRVLVNDRVIPLESCGADALGRCTLDAFVSSLNFAQSGGLWDQCFT
ncbi:histidine phosphatase superfamily [Pseudomassariella vexata]|uniref:Phytase A n=1 Tax=Pseudomassariella vexata TaxID=1141098 RepID=A0A1Y2EDW1_9PEZI|nr:histidine phosphatase superfamily [Pseudomassariella vexata]ORY68975.1 histidine phosphatase superfamily [Pseudomassariella vexata]